MYSCSVLDDTWKHARFLTAVLTVCPLALRGSTAETLLDPLSSTVSSLRGRAKPSQVTSVMVNQMPNLGGGSDSRQVPSRIARSSAVRLLTCEIALCICSSGNSSLASAGDGEWGHASKLTYGNRLGHIHGTLWM